MKKLFCLAFLISTAITFAQEGYSVLSIPKEYTEYANSVLMDELIDVDVTDIGKMKVKSHRVVAILNKLGDDDTNLYEYYDTNSKVKDIEVYVYDAFGNEIEHFKKKDFMDVSRTGGSIYQDDRAFYINYTPVTYPYIVVFDSETESGDSAFIKPWYPVMGYSKSTLKSVMKIKYNPTNKPRYIAKNLEGYKINIAENPEELVFTASNIASIRYEEHSPSVYDFIPHVNIALDNFELKGVVGSTKDWKQFGSWMNKSLLTDVRELPEGTIARVKSLVANETTNEGKARKIYQYLQDKVRYISIQIGIGGWKPMLASDVEKLSYGDCKALTNYTKALLDAVEVPSYYTILYAGDNERDIMNEFASIQGNHACLAIPDGNEMTWLECTSQDVPYGFIGDFTDDRDVLIITPEGGKIVHTKIYSAEESTQKNIANVKLDATGNVLAHFESISKGLQYDDKYILPKQKQEEVDKHYKEKWSYINGLSVQNIEFINNREDIIFTEKAQLNIPHYANAVGNDYLFCANIFNQMNHIPPRILERKQDLYLSHGFTDIDTVEVELPENYSVESLPEATVLETKFGKYTMDFNVNSENKIIYTRTLRITKGQYPPQEYDNYRDFCRSIARLDKTKILLNQHVQ